VSVPKTGSRRSLQRPVSTAESRSRGLSGHSLSTSSPSGARRRSRRRRKYCEFKASKKVANSTAVLTRVKADGNYSEINIERWRITRSKKLEIEGFEDKSGVPTKVIVSGANLKEIRRDGDHDITIEAKDETLFLTFIADTDSMSCKTLIREVKNIINHKEVETHGTWIISGLKRTGIIRRNIPIETTPGSNEAPKSLLAEILMDAGARVANRILEAQRTGQIERKNTNNYETQKNPDLLLEELESMTGLDKIKNEVRSMVNKLKIDELRRKQGLRVIGGTNHMVFTGNPGTGKTTIARKLGEIYKSLGLLSIGHMTEVDRSGLVAGYLGQTAIKTKEVLEKAKGGILFIDEAYTLSSSGSTGDSDQFGQEAIDTILKYMEDEREDLVVIVAGYTSLMDGFLKSNPGIRSRFNKTMHFEDYAADELHQIFKATTKLSGYKLTERAEQKSIGLFESMVATKKEDFGNGRTVRNVFDKCIANQSDRLAKINSLTKDLLIEIREEDIPEIQ